VLTEPPEERFLFHGISRPSYVSFIYIVFFKTGYWIYDKSGTLYVLSIAPIFICLLQANIVWNKYRYLWSIFVTNFIIIIIIIIIIFAITFTHGIHN